MGEGEGKNVPCWWEGSLCHDPLPSRDSSATPLSPDPIPHPPLTPGGRFGRAPVRTAGFNIGAYLRPTLDLL